jgi:hypothetical protein
MTTVGILILCSLIGIAIFLYLKKTKQDKLAKSAESQPKTDSNLGLRDLTNENPPFLPPSPQQTFVYKAPEAENEIIDLDQMPTPDSSTNSTKNTDLKSDE